MLPAKNIDTVGILFTLKEILLWMLIQHLL